MAFFDLHKPKTRIRGKKEQRLPFSWRRKRILQHRTSLVLADDCTKFSQPPLPSGEHHEKRISQRFEEETSQENFKELHTKKCC